MFKYAVEKRDSQIGRYSKFLNRDCSGKKHLATRYLEEDRPRQIELIKNQLEVDLCARIYSAVTPFEIIKNGGPCPRCKDLGMEVPNSAEHFLFACPKFESTRRELEKLLGSRVFTERNIVKLWNENDCIYRYIAECLFDKKKSSAEEAAAQEIVPLGTPKLIHRTKYWLAKAESRRERSYGNGCGGKECIWFQLSASAACCPGIGELEYELLGGKLFF